MFFFKKSNQDAKDCWRSNTKSIIQDPYPPDHKNYGFYRIWVQETFSSSPRFRYNFSDALTAGFFVLISLTWFVPDSFDLISSPYRARSRFSCSVRRQRSTLSERPSCQGRPPHGLGPVSQSKKVINRSIIPHKRIRRPEKQTILQYERVTVTN